MGRSRRHRHTQYIHEWRPYPHLEVELRLVLLQRAIELLEEAHLVRHLIIRVGVRMCVSVCVLKNINNFSTTHPTTVGCLTVQPDTHRDQPTW